MSPSTAAPASTGAPTGAPEISAILCTYNRAGLLREALQSLCTQTLPVERFEVVLIDDGSTDDTRAVVDAFRPLLNIQAVHQSNAGLAAAKNRALDTAGAPIVVFVDDDDRMDPDCLQQHLLTHQAYPQPEVAVLGYTDMATDVAASPLMHYVTGRAGLLFSYASLNDGEQLDYRYFWGGRSSCKRALLQQHGQFNPVFRFGAEDIELGYRLSKAGLRVIFNRAAVSQMLRRLDFDQFCRRSEMQGRSNRVFAELHPDPEVIAYTGIDDARRLWPEIEPRYQQILAAGRGLDRYAQARADQGLGIDGLSTRLLHQAYRRAFDASRLRGSAGVDKQAGSAP